jgi:hypothetical protein
MMNIHGSIIGLAALLAAGSANAAVVYDTLTGQTAANTNLLTNGTGFHAPLGSDFTTSFAQTINSVDLALYAPSCGANLNCTDAGSVLVYLVSGSGTPGLPSATGLHLTNPIYLGTILDTELLGGGGANIATDITLNTNVTIGAGTWWIELTSGSDPNNFYQSINTTASVAKWGEILTTATGTIGVPTDGWYTSGTNLAVSAIIGGISNHSTGANPSPNDEIFMMTIDATVATPEPTSLALFGAGLLGLGFKRFRRSSKPAVA